ncbi:MAG: ribonuclease III domain-containing protein [Lachnospiraceae bacterium]|nr:ribonuclease III domain-containing protein [Lachnospiraceae bacterium]MDD6578176.1 ribonuclease III domain-containing protein [Lachnospiraceae bacterium]
MAENLNALIRKRFEIPSKDLSTFSPLTLAFLGDGVYEIIIRTLIVDQGNTSPSRLHKQSAHIVKAQSQAQVIDLLEADLTEEEKDIVRRGRNAKSNTHAKNASVMDYRKATAFEALLGYLYLKGEDERILSLVETGLKKGKFI